MIFILQVWGSGYFIALKDLGPSDHYDDYSYHIDYDPFSNEFGMIFNGEQSYLFNVYGNLSAYFSDILIPLPFMIFDDEKGKLIYEMIPKRVRNLLEKCFCKKPTFNTNVIHVPLANP